MSIRIIFASLVIASLLTGCGVRGKLDAPEGTPKEPSDKAIILDKII